MSIARDELAAYIFDLLEMEAWVAADKSLNGLQVQGDERVDSVALAVDGCQQTFSRCAELGRKFLIVHHGLFWGSPLAITGAHYTRIKTLLGCGNLAVRRAPSPGTSIPSWDITLGLHR